MTFGGMRDPIITRRPYRTRMARASSIARDSQPATGLRADRGRPFYTGKIHLAEYSRRRILVRKDHRLPTYEFFHRRYSATTAPAN